MKFSRGRFLRYAILSLALTLTCLVSGQPLPAQNSTLSHQRKRDADVKEVVFRYLFDRYGKPSKAQVYFLAFKGSDSPSEVFMQRFRRYEKPVKPVSQAKIVFAVKDKETSNPGILYIINSLNWVNNHEANVEAMYHLNRKAGIGAVYQVKRQNARWVVLREKVKVLF